MPEDTPETTVRELIEMLGEYPDLRVEVAVVGMSGTYTPSSVEMNKEHSAVILHVTV